MHSIPPRLTEKSYRPRVSNRTMVGVLEPPRFACVASGPKASNHRVMKPSNRNRRLPWSVRNMSRTQSLSTSEIGLDANRHIHLRSERTEGKSFLDIPSHRTRRAVLSSSSAIRSVWSAAVSQAKSEDGRLGLRKCIRSLGEPKLVTLMECAALSSCLISQPLKGLSVFQVSRVPGSTGFAISLFASRPGRSCELLIFTRR